jgi:hypothetical protein
MANDEFVVSNPPQDPFINLRTKYFYAGFVHDSCFSLIHTKSRIYSIGY